MKVQYVIPIVIAAFVMGGFLTYQVTASRVDTPNTAISTSSTEARLNKGKLTNPLLECNINQDVGEREFSSIESKVTTYIDSEKKSGRLIDAAVYYRDLNNGPWFGIHEKENFSPSSLLKLPVMMAYYKLAESNPKILGKEILFPGNLDALAQDIKPSEELEKDNSYSVEDLIFRMIAYSDNNALILLENNIDNYLIDKVTLDLGIPTATNSTPEDYLSVKDYSSLFRVLYNASYLRSDLSEKALSILTKSDFSDGIVSGIKNKDVVVAHKMGERDLSNGIKQLHDCGIVYYSSRPYLLCIMTRGNDFTALSSIIDQISGEIFSEVSKRYPIL